MTFFLDILLYLLFPLVITISILRRVEKRVNMLYRNNCEIKRSLEEFRRYTEKRFMQLDTANRAVCT